MKTLIYTRCNMTLWSVVLMLAFVPVAWAYPPDNAAVLYYRAFFLMENPNDDLADAVQGYSKWLIPSSERIEQFLRNHRRVIDMLTEASRIEHCDWGVDYSKGIDMLLPELSKARQATFLLLADSRQRAQSAEYSEALERCLTVHRMANHVGQGAVISHLVEIATRALAHQAIANVLSEMHADEPTLIWLKTGVSQAGAKRGTLKAALQKEAETMAYSICLEAKDSLVSSLSEPDPNRPQEAELLAKIQKADEVFFESSRRYWLDYMANVQNVLDLPFPQAYEQFKHLEGKPVEDAKHKDEALLTAVLSSAFTKCLCLDVKETTHFNALKTAIELYLINDRTGQLPDQLPPGLPKDLFSDGDFEYQRTKEGFILRCRAKDPNKDQTHEYAFTVK